MQKVEVAQWDALKDREPAYALVANVDLVIVRYDDQVSVFHGRCPHRGALLSDGFVSGTNLICGVHKWDFRYDTGVSEYNEEEVLPKFSSWVEDGRVVVDEEEIAEWIKEHPQPFNRDAYLGLYADTGGTDAEPHNHFIQQLAKDGLSKLGHHGPMAAMGVPRDELPLWDDIQLVTAQLSTVPLLDEDPVGTEVVIGPNAKKPLTLKIPLFVSDMSFGALSEEAKVSLAMGAEQAGTGICSGEGGMLPEEQEVNSRYFYELASGRFGYSMDKVQRCQAFHFKGGQGAKTGTGGHLPGEKVKGKIAQVRGLAEGTPAVSPPRFPDWKDIKPIKAFAAEVREATGGIPIGYKLSAQHIEDDIDAALEVGVDYIMVITGGLRVPADFAKALAMGADAIAVSNSALQAIGCIGMRACHTNNCPVGIATQKEHLRQRLDVQESAKQLGNFFNASVELMQVLARACGHTHFNQFNAGDLTTWKKDMADLTGIEYGGMAGRK